MSPSDLTAIGVVIACAIWAVWRLWRKLRGRTSCGCDHCPAVRNKDRPGSG